MKIKIVIGDINCEAETDFNASSDSVRIAQFARLCSEVNNIATKLINAKYNKNKEN